MRYVLCNRRVIEVLMSERLCPKCGAYWSCDCSIDELLPLRDDGCEHDWTEAVGVEVVDGVIDLESARVMFCRLCGLYSVREKV